MSTATILLCGLDHAHHLELQQLLDQAGCHVMVAPTVAAATACFQAQVAASVREFTQPIVILAEPGADPEACSTCHQAGAREDGSQVVAGCDKPQPDLLILALRLLRFADLTGTCLPAADRRIILGSRERLILSKVAQGLPNKAIAQEQGISVRTVGSHLQHIFRKLDASNRMEAVLHARQQGLLRNE